MVDVDARGQRQKLSTRYRKPRTENEIEASFLCVFIASRAMRKWMFGQPLVVSGNGATKVELEHDHSSMTIRTMAPT